MNKNTGNEKAYLAPQWTEWHAFHIEDWPENMYDFYKQGYERIAACL